MESVGDVLTGIPTPPPPDIWQGGSLPIVNDESGDFFCGRETGSASGHEIEEDALQIVRIVVQRRELCLPSMVGDYDGSVK
jgi:hypothetical protein